MPDVARRLLGEPDSKARREWRYGRRGSLKIDLAAGTWKDFEQDEGGGVLDLVERERSTDKAGALDWLKQEGFLNGQPVLPPVGPAPAMRETVKTGKSKSHPGRLWDAARFPGGTPARRYLSERFTWPPEGIGPDLPDSVRWLSREAAPRSDESLEWYRLPAAVAGAAVFAWRTCNGELSGVSMEGLDRDGRRPDQTERGKRWRPVFGSRTGAGFAVGVAGGDPLVLVEGEADALACTWLYPAAEVWAIGGTSGTALGAAIPHGRRVIIEADPDAAGRRAALKLDVALDGRAQIEWNRNGLDPADVWKAEFLDQAARFEFDGDLDRTAAEKAAWERVLKNQE